MRTQPNQITPERLALSVADVAELLNVSERHIWKLNASGRMPAPVRLGRSVRWSRTELVDWLDARCPSRDEWQSIDRQNRRHLRAIAADTDK